MTDRELLQQALDALLNYPLTEGKAIQAIRTRLAQPEPEPVAWLYKTNNTWEHVSFVEPPDDAYDEGSLCPVYTAPPKKEWVGLTDEERQRCFNDVEWNKVDWCPDHEQYAKAIEAKLKEKNT